MQDTYKHKGMRKQLIDQLRQKGISDERVLEAFDAIPRHFFLDLAFEQQAYSNVAFQIGSGQTISHPYTVAFQTSILELKKGEKVLEIGTGSGFQTCILCSLGMKVFSIERQKELHIKAKKLIDHFRFTPKLFFGDGYEGKETYAPFDKILVTCGAPFIPQKLLQQLKVGGMMVIPVGDLDSQEMHRITKISDAEYKEEVFGNFSFVPMLEKTVR
ncbi:protein-L-isoaspartate(D-aspartate) O-methyltransferase [Fluviicola sp.]|jgi:protein-L-isoaspartate(D-aspartate) O-methyltransferase|uniref:protein-L-isoaspartate(D-aspartate) O-methyltransferase n=1 Tax=Fluviicola sp. TaxID=1917219 RepID=UPI002825EF5F|nr:protein-L-isoaspartate(D-aspartate) O-methyltransferase [Fluviicola sp.]MDR0802561.1 protein-L-isoaspartate(D-aspartate) O-methyltransferase [Fluviicola sp.]